MQIHQLQVLFDPAEDRLRIRLSTTAGEEFRLFLTRRFVRLLWPEIHKVVTASTIARVPAAVVPDEVVAFEREKALATTDFKTPYQEPQAEVPRRFPLGETPFLATRGRIRQDRPGLYRLTLDPQSGPGIELALDDRLMHSFIRLLDSAVQGADWNLDAASGPPAQEPPAAADPGSARVLN
jgi:hypothetical protein